MSFRRSLLHLALALGAFVTLGSTVEAQGKSKHYTVSNDRALMVTREVLVKQGFDVVKVEDRGDYQIVHYRRGNMGKGKGKGPMEQMIIRKVQNRIVFEAAPSGILVDIDLRLRL